MFVGVNISRTRSWCTKGLLRNHYWGFDDLFLGEGVGTDLPKTLGGGGGTQNWPNTRGHPDLAGKRKSFIHQSNDF